MLVLFLKWSNCVTCWHRYFGTKCSWPSIMSMTRMSLLITDFAFYKNWLLNQTLLSWEFEQYFGPKNKQILKTSNAWGGCCDRGMLKLLIDWCISMYHTQPMKCDQILSILTEWAYILIHSSLLAHNTEHPFVH